MAMHKVSRFLKNKKAAAGLIAIIIILIAFFFIGWLINVSQRECKTNSDCGSSAYCGSDFGCHEYPNIQKTEYNFFWPAVILAIGIVLAVLIYRLLPPLQWPKPEEKTEKVEIKPEEPVVEEKEEEVYYKSSKG